MKRFFVEKLGSLIVTLTAIALVIWIGGKMVDAHLSEVCNGIKTQKVEHDTMGLYPGFYVTEQDRKDCKAIGVNL